MPVELEAAGVPAHDQAEDDSYVEHFPDHEQRSETEEFRATKARLERELGLGCAYCLLASLGALMAAGKLPASPGDCTLPSGATVHPLAWYLRRAGELMLYPGHDKPLESHHWAVEWAHAAQADWAKVDLYASMCDWYGLHAEGRLAGRAPISSPDDDRTQLILCAEHHRGEGFGVHHVPMPPWSAGLVVRDGEAVLEPPGGHHPVLPRGEFGPLVTPPRRRPGRPRGSGTKHQEDA